MRQLTSRSAIYVVIGIGLLILVVSQFKRGNEASNASFSANTNPFEALNNYQPTAPKAEVGQNLVEGFNGQRIIRQVPQVDAVASELPVEWAAKNIEPNVDIQADFVNTPKVPETVPAPADNDESFYDLGFDNFEQEPPLADDVSENTEPMDLVDAASEKLKQGSLAVIDSISTGIESVTKGIEDVSAGNENVSATIEPAATAMEPASTNMPAFRNVNKIGSNGRTQITNSHIASPGVQPESKNLQSTRWKKNPFISDDQVDAATTEVPTNSIASDTLPAAAISVDALPANVEAMIQSEFTNSPEELSTTANFEPATIANVQPAAEPPAQAMVPAIDHETMQSVVSVGQNLEAGSPAIKIGITQSDAQKAVHNIEYGKSLSRRSAAYAARQEFYSALRILAQSHDRQVGGTAYTKALRNGIIAIKEAQDFIVTDTETQIGLSVSNVIETHSTKVIAPGSAEGMTAMEAVQRYFAYASHQLSLSGGQNAVAAEALYCLGKLHSVQAKSGATSSKLDFAKSMVYHQAAVSADPSSFRSLNELGVLYANSGRLDESKYMLKKSLRIKQLPQAWQNLSVIHQRMGESQLAELANREFEVVSAQAPASVIRWAPVEEFNKNAPLTRHKVSQASAELPIPTGKNSGISNLKNLGGRILNSIR